MVGVAKKLEDGWVVKYIKMLGGPNSRTSEVCILRLHPDDEQALDPTKSHQINFTVFTIATGMSEFDVMDEDVAKIM